MSFIYELKKRLIFFLEMDAITTQRINQNDDALFIFEYLTGKF